ncbi:hypothetical protein [Paenibacillus sp. 8b26]|uniref:hypothetical protein n=1 Tax=Paenibacillus sp. 8b26 TaxID=3424133 RepID=UPI003D64CF2E
MEKKDKANIQAIQEIIRKEQVWESDTGKKDAALYYYHITYALKRQWQTIGVNVSDAIQVFETGYDDNWTYIIEPAPYNPDLTFTDLINMFNISPEAWEIRNDMQIILNTVERRNEFVSMIVNVNEESTARLLRELKEKYLTYCQLLDGDFMKLYAVNPVNALSVYFLEPLDIVTFWDWEAAGGSYKKAIQYKREEPLISLIHAIERAEDEAMDIAFGLGC